LIFAKAREKSFVGCTTSHNFNLEKSTGFILLHEEAMIAYNTRASQFFIKHFSRSLHIIALSLCELSLK
jgi:hypothetical protein